MKHPRFNASHFALITFLVFVSWAAIPLAAQEEAETRQRTVIKATMHIEVGEAQSVLELLDVDFALKPDQNLIVLRGENGQMETALKVIDALDQPRPSIELQVHVLAASKQGEAVVPQPLEAAVGQLQNIFGFRGFKLLDTVLLRVLEGRHGRADGGIPLGESQTRTGYHFSFQKISVVPEDGFNDIRIKDLKFEVHGKAAGWVRASLMTDVKIREGQKAVIGSSTPQGTGETLILIVEAQASPDPRN